jgi:hypothetical protein
MSQMLESESPTSLSPSDINGDTGMGKAGEQSWTGTGGRRRKSRGKKSKKTVGGMKKTVGGKKSRRTGKKVKKSKSGKSRKSRRR